MLYAMDRSWWKVYRDDALVNFQGSLVTCIQRVNAVCYEKIEHGRNSGSGAIGLAKHYGAKKIILLGYDCKKDSDGKKHWHGDHPAGLKNAGLLNKWPEQFKATAKIVKNIKVINATRDTALTCFDLATLEDALNERD